MSSLFRSSVKMLSDRVPTFLVTLLVLAWVLAFPQACSAQGRAGSANAELPRAEYYIARDLFDAGNLREATDGFRLSVDRGLQLPQQRWIDCIPPLVMLGECYYQQGALAMAMEQYDAALEIALAYPQWPLGIQPNGITPQEITVSPKGFAWGTSVRKVKLVRVPDSVLIALDPVAVKQLPAGAQPIQPVMRLDVSEVFRCMAIALHRRSQLLGPLNKYSPLTPRLNAAFATPPAGAVNWVTSTWQVLHGLQLAAIGEKEQARAKLQVGSMIEGQADYFMTPASLLAISSLDLQAEEYPAALSRLSDAALRSAQLEQFDTLSEVLTRIAAASIVSGKTDSLKNLQVAAVWAEPFSQLVYVTACTATAELAFATGNMQMHEALTKQALARLTTADVTLPRVQAQLGYTLARASAHQEKTAAAWQQLDAALALLRGNAQIGASTPRVFQTQVTLELSTRGVIPPAESELLFSELLSEPSPFDWRFQPLECLVSITTAHTSAFERWLELAVKRESVEDVLVRMDRLQRQRFFEALPLGGRCLAARRALCTDPDQLDPATAEIMHRVSAVMPDVAKTAAVVRKASARVLADPLNEDDRQADADAKKRMSDLIKECDRLETGVLSVALARSPLPRIAPPPSTMESLTATLEPTDCVIAYAHTAKHVYGLAITKQSRSIWTMADPALIDTRVNTVLNDIGVIAGKNHDFSAASPAWKTSAAELSAVLIPADARKAIESAERVILVPSGNLWYVPFDLLPVGQAVPGGTNGAPMLAKKRVCTMPTIGSIPRISVPAPRLEAKLGLYGSMFSNDRQVNQAWNARCIQAFAGARQINLLQKNNLAAPAGLRLQSDRLLVTADILVGKVVWDMWPIPLDPTQDNALSAWIQSPMRSPGQLLLPGLQTAVTKGKLDGGNDLFLTACVLQETGTRAAWLSRWKVGGNSAHLLLTRLLDELDFESPSSSWQRAATALWAEKIASTDEPLIALNKSVPAEVSGSEPILWAGYILIGDHLPPK
ncbi:MAG: hypothetical protein U0892_07610 [Pirellulales bacterium]